MFASRHLGTFRLENCVLRETVTLWLSWLFGPYSPPSLSSFLVSLPLEGAHHEAGLIGADRGGVWDELGLIGRTKILNFPLSSVKRHERFVFVCFFGVKSSIKTGFPG